MKLYIVFILGVIVTIFVVQQRLLQKDVKKDVLMCDGGGFPAFWFSLGKGRAHRDSVKEILGYSSGSIAAVILASVDDIDVSYIIECGMEAQKLEQLSDTIATFLDKILPEDAHIRCNGRLGIILCAPSRFFTCRVERYWNTRKQLIDCVVASSYIPGIVGSCIVDPIYKCIDGGLSINLNTFRSNAITTKSFKYVGYIESLKPVDRYTAFELFKNGLKKN